MLRHRVDLGELSGVDRSVEERRVLPRYRAPVKVEFRRGGDMDVVDEALKSNRTIQLGAAVGSGKSTQVPSLIARKLGVLVIHTIPFPLAAQCLAEYLANRADGLNISYVDDLESDLPQRGVVLMSNAHLCARYMNRKLDNLSGAVLYLDEVHESDCWTAVIRKVGPGLECFSNVVLATATSTPGERMPNHLPGDRKEFTYQPVKTDMWSAYDEGKPWSANNLDGNTMICLDRVAARQKLAAEYEQCGFLVFCLDSHSTYSEFRAMLDQLKRPDDNSCVILVDYAYRSSFTIPKLDTIIDSCEVAVAMMTEDGTPGHAYRKAYDFEVQQFLGRGGRVKGESVRLYKCAVQAPLYMCDLEKLEADAANLLYRFFGFRPPQELVNFEYYEGDVPIEIAEGFLSDHPLRAAPSESREPWVNGNAAIQRVKEKPSAFQYSLPKRGRSKHMTCVTDAEFERPSTPPPPVPKNHVVTRVSSREFDHYADRRASSPTATVYTIASGEPDTLSMYENRETLLSGKPKRVAQRVLDERAAASAVVEAEFVDGYQPVASLTAVPDLPAHVEMPPVVPPKTSIEFSGLTQQMRQLHGSLREGSHGGSFSELPESELGEYYFYHGMDSAPSSSDFFLRGYESILEFAEERQARAHSRAMPKRDKLYAMKVLVDQFNSSTAIALGIGRLFAEIANRKAADLEGLIDQQGLVETIEWMMRKRADAELVVRMCKRIMPMFMVYELDKMPRALQLEQRVMIEMMEKFEKVSAKKDPGKMDTYLQSLNSRNVRVTAGIGPAKTQLYLQ